MFFTCVCVCVFKENRLLDLSSLSLAWAESSQVYHICDLPCFSFHSSKQVLNIGPMCRYINLSDDCIHFFWKNIWVFVRMHLLKWDFFFFFFFYSEKISRINYLVISDKCSMVLGNCENAYMHNQIMHWNWVWLNIFLQGLLFNTCTYHNNKDAVC